MSARPAVAALALMLALAAGPVGAIGTPPSPDAGEGAAPPPDVGSVMPGASPPAGQAAAIPAPPQATSGAAIYDRFVEGLAQPGCEDASPRWRAHYAHVPRQLASGEGEVLPLFGYVVEALRSAHLPTEYALIPFVESGYRPGARSASGPAGLWQFIAATARNHDVPIRGGYDGRLSPVDATRAAVRYLKTLHGMFAGDWRLAVMAFNAGEYRVLGALRRHGQRPADAQPQALESLSRSTRAYVRKLHALSCLMMEAGGDAEWTRALDRPVSRLVAVELTGESAGLESYARRNGLDPARLKRLNPAHRGGTARQSILVPAGATAVPAAATMAN
ncbi:lytic transglycosylase domain-containing protein [Luteimonas granuli]|uniref:Lytic transglycosylase domain-containing protein n=1 Tax=Luteimonas granuli TaxID=1176533 RepID=A0A518N646_9GAMM|nr:lytic transglycosylase domain-containing protein [Luteimonas granuli]QDW67396.1 lytic transglycosylase domain-containing protein [Luteimonas granuli]